MSHKIMMNNCRSKVMFSIALGWAIMLEMDSGFQIPLMSSVIMAFFLPLLRFRNVIKINILMAMLVTLEFHIKYGYIEQSIFSFFPVELAPFLLLSMVLGIFLEIFIATLTLTTIDFCIYFICIFLFKKWFRVIEYLEVK